MKLKLKDPWSAITHGIALLLAAAGTAPLLLKAAHGENAPLHITALAIFILTMILLYTASTVYHSVDSTEKVNRRLRKMDHMMIFVMIAGSYTPICLIALHNRTGYILCALVWSIAILGILLKGLWITCPKWLSSVLYIGMDGFVYLLLFLSFIPFREPDLDGFLPGGANQLARSHPATSPKQAPAAASLSRNPPHVSAIRAPIAPTAVSSAVCAAVSCRGR